MHVRPVGGLAIVQLCMPRPAFFPNIRGRDTKGGPLTIFSYKIYLLLYISICICKCIMYRGGQPYKKTAGAQRGPNNLAVTAGVVRCRSSLDLVGFPVGAAHRENLAKLPQVYKYLPQSLSAKAGCIFDKRILEGNVSNLKVANVFSLCVALSTHISCFF